MTSYPASAPVRGESGTGYKLLALFLGLVVCIMGTFGLWLALSAQHARDDARQAAENARVAQPAATGTGSMAGMSHGTTAAAGYATPSFAGVAPANADALATAHKAFPAELPAAPAGPVAAVTLPISHAPVSIHSASRSSSARKRSVRTAARARS